MTTMPKLIVYTTQRDPTKVSSVVSRYDRSIRQKQLPTRYDSPSARNKIYLQPCESHDLETAVTVSAEVYYYSPFLKKSQSMGTAKICFFCRTILTVPSKGWVHLSDGQLSQLNNKLSDLSQTMKDRSARKKRKENHSIPTSPVVQPKEDDGFEDATEDLIEEGSPDIDWLE